MNNFRRYAAAAQQSVLQKLGNIPKGLVFRDSLKAKGQSIVQRKTI